LGGEVKEVKEDSIWYDRETKEVLLYQGYRMHRGPLLLFKRLLDPEGETVAMREPTSTFNPRLIPLTEMEAIAWVAKHGR
jgi:hypothetical protein